MSKEFRELRPLMQSHEKFENVFKKELQSCYELASQASEAGDDRLAMIQLAQARVWEKLLRAATFKQ